MEQFNLDIWLQDRSRKIVTRDGRPVRIVCWDAKKIKTDCCFSINKKYKSKTI